MRKMLLFALRILGESVGATYGSAALAYSVAFGLILLIGDHRRVDIVLTSPTFLLPISAGALFAYILRNHLSKASYFAWLVPGALLFRAALEVVRSPQANSSETWNALLGTNCGASECLYEAFFTLPFVCALSYSLSSFCIRAARRSSDPAREKTL
jgi:hypothetical protein